MRNIWKIFMSDLQKLRHNPIGLLVIFGVVVIPSLYAWFNTAASWDPYSNTDELQVAVASMDKGYTGELISVKVNFGENVLSKLHENNQLNWTFTTDERAIEGVRSGKYYAAIIIPENFSQLMMSVFSLDVDHPEILYYCNEKENAIAPKVTDKGASALQKQINEVFVQTLTDSVYVTMQTLLSTMDEKDSLEFFNQIIDSMDDISNELNAAAGTIQAFSRMTDATVQMFSTTESYLQQSQELVQYSMDALDKNAKPLETVQSSIKGATDSVNSALDESKSYYQQMADEIKNAFSKNPVSTDEIASLLERMADNIQPVISSYEKMIEAVEDIQTSHPELSDVTGPVLAKLNEALNSQNTLKEKLTLAADQIRISEDNIASVSEMLDQLTNQSIQDISSVKNDYEENVQDKLNALYTSLDDTETTVIDILSQIDHGTDQLNELTETASSDLVRIQKILQQTSDLLSESADQLDNTVSYLSKAAKDKDMAVINNILSSSQDEVSGFLSSPVQLKTNKIFPVENYGSSMAPFYTALSIWVGGIVLVAMLKVDISEENKKNFIKLHHWQAYFGRFILFMILGLLQSTLICLGDLYYLRIQCLHPFMFMMAGWLSSIVYVLVIYTLTISFGDIGKAICVILLVMQVAGSGGTFPIETAPEFFRMCYPFFPFGHTMNAMRECIAGLYGEIYWKEMLQLCYFAVGALVLGIVLRVPLIRFNHFFTEKLESTHLI